jgi:asparagine synthase (glutamine-hydrolysing)
MQWFFGVAATGLPDAEVSETIRELVSANSRPERPPEMAIRNGYGIASLTRDGLAARHEGLICAVTGAPEFSDRKLDEEARDTGLASTLIRSYRQIGTEVLSRLRGPFSLALTDADAGTSILAIDRMGVGQSYYTERAARGLIFGTSARQVLAHPDCPRELDDQALFHYLYFHMVPGPGSVYKDIRKLTQGQYLIHSGGRLETHRYWRPHFAVGKRLSEKSYAEEARSLLGQSVRRCLGSKPAACFLSGGIDSSTIVGLVSEYAAPARSFTIGFDEPGYDETVYARTAAAHFGAESIEYRITPGDVVSILPTIASAYDEPFGNSSVVPTYYCAKVAREHGIELMLAGDGGDELFAGNTRYVTQQIFGIYDHVPLWLRERVLEPVCFRVPGFDRLWPTRKLQSYIRQAKEPMPDRLQTYNYFSRSAAQDILHADFFDALDLGRPLEMQRDTYESSVADSMLNKMLELDWKYTLADNDLRKVTRMCELAGVEVGFPWLDDDLVAFSERLPPDLKIRFFRLRYFIKRALKGFLPHEVITKSKHGFGLPFGVWMKDYEPLRELAYDSLSDLAGRRIVRRSYLDDLVEKHRTVHAHYYGEFIWVLMMLELWLRSHRRGSTVQ